jgi:hypothetical protein
VSTIHTALKKLISSVVKEELEKMNIKAKAKGKRGRPRKEKAEAQPEIAIEKKIVMSKETKRYDKLGRVISPRKKQRSDFGKKRKGQALKNIRVASAKVQARLKLEKQLAELGAS